MSSIRGRDRVDTDLPYQLKHATGAEVVGGDLRLQIERTLLRLAVFSAIRRSMPRSTTPALRMRVAGIADPLLEDTHRVGGDRTWHPAADIGMGPMLAVKKRGSGPFSPWPEHRRHDRDVGHVGAGAR